MLTYTPRDSSFPGLPLLFVSHLFLIYSFVASKMISIHVYRRTTLDIMIIVCYSIGERRVNNMGESLGDRIALLLKKSGYNQKELAGMVGVTEAAMSKYLNNIRQPRAEVIANLATALNTTSDYLIRGVQPEDDFAEVYKLVARSATSMSDEQKMELVRILVGK